MRSANRRVVAAVAIPAWWGRFGTTAASRSSDRLLEVEEGHTLSARTAPAFVHARGLEVTSVTNGALDVPGKVCQQGPVRSRGKRAEPLFGGRR